MHIGQAFSARAAMTSLLEIQARFSQALLGDSSGPIAVCVTTDRLSPEARVQIYRNHVRITLCEALAATFPVVARLVGPDYFAAVCRRFIAAHPPTSPVLAEYGASFSTYLATAPNAPEYLPDVARLEWAMNESFRAPDAPSFSVTDLAGLSPIASASLRFQPHPSARLVHSKYPILRIWAVNQDCVQAGNLADATVDLAEGEVTVLLWRQDGDVAVRALLGAHKPFVEALLAGGCLTDAAEAAFVTDPTFDLALALVSLVQAPVFAAASPSE
jgi:hypothetical protein